MVKGDYGLVGLLNAFKFNLDKASGEPSKRFNKLSNSESEKLPIITLSPPV